MESGDRTKPFPVDLQLYVYFCLIPRLLSVAWEETGRRHKGEIHCTHIRPDNVPTSYWHILSCLTLFTLPLLPFLVAIATARSFASGSPQVRAVIATPADYSDRQRDIVR